MDRPLRDHIAELEQRLNQLTVMSMESPLNRSQLNAMEREIRVVALALTHFREALKLERQLSRIGVPGSENRWAASNLPAHFEGTVVPRADRIDCYRPDGC